MITADMTREEAENALSDYRQDNSRIAQSSAHRRRVVLALHQRNGWKALGYETPERFAQAELSLGRRAYFAIIERAKTEQQIITALPDFAKENVKDWVLTVLQEYAAADQQQIAAQLLQARSAARRGLHDRGLPSIKGKQITDTAERLGIVPLVEKAKSNTDTALLFAPKPPPANDITPYTAELYREEADILWQIRAQLANSFGEAATPSEAIRWLLRMHAAQTQTPPNAKPDNIRDSYQVLHEDEEECKILHSSAEAPLPTALTFGEEDETHDPFSDTLPEETEVTDMVPTPAFAPTHILEGTVPVVLLSRQNLTARVQRQDGTESTEPLEFLKRIP